MSFLQIGKTLEVLIEERQGEYMVGRASNYLKVKAKLSDDTVGQVYQLKIIAQDDVELIGSVENEKNQ